MIVPVPSRKDGVYTEYYWGVDWILKRATISFIIAFFFSLIALPLTYMVSNGFTYDSWQKCKEFIAYLPAHPFFFVRSYFGWMLAFAKNPASLALWIPVMPLFIFIGGTLYAFYSNPHQFAMWSMGAGRPANDWDITNMGLFKGTMILLGKWKNKLVRMTDSLSVLCVGGIGTGKTAGIIIPNILTLDDCCLMIHDLWGTIYDKTAGYRAKLGPVIRVCFEGIDKPDKNVFFPTWNPLGEGELPPPSPGRQNYIGGLAFFLVPDGPVGTDPYWTKAGRSTLEGLINYLCDKVEQARANDYFLQRFYEDAIDDDDLDVLETYYNSMQKTKEVRQALNDLRSGKLTLNKYLPIGSWAGIPDEWVGRQQSFPMLLDFIAKMQLDMNGELRARRDIGDPVAFKTDVWAKIIGDFVAEANYYGYTRRALLELNQLLALPKNQRGTVLSVAMSGLSPFKLSSVRCRTASTDFVSVNYRGIKNPFTDKWEPVTFYIDSPSKAPIASILGLFLNMTMGTLTVFGPSEGPCGPFKVVYLMDDFNYVPAFGSVFDGVSIGRAKEYAFLFTCSDLSQLSAVYGGGFEVLVHQTGAKILMRLDNNETIEQFMGLVDNQTFVYKSYSRTEGPNIINNPFERNVGYQVLGKNIIRVTVMSNLPTGAEYILSHKNINRPIKAKVPFYFKDSSMMKKVNLPAPPFLPAYMYEMRAPEDKLPPTEMQLENVYEKTVRIAEREAQEDLVALRKAEAEYAAQARAVRKQTQGEEEWVPDDWEDSVYEDADESEEYEDGEEYEEYEDGEEEQGEDGGNPQ